MFYSKSTSAYQNLDHYILSLKLIPTFVVCSFFLVYLNIISHSITLAYLIAFISPPDTIEYSFARPNASLYIFLFFFLLFSSWLKFNGIYTDDYYSACALLFLFYWICCRPINERTNEDPLGLLKLLPIIVASIEEIPFFFLFCSFRSISGHQFSNRFCLLTCYFFKGFPFAAASAAGIGAGAYPVLQNQFG